MTVKDNLDGMDYSVKSFNLIMAPNSTQYVGSDYREKVLNVMDIIDNHDDVNQVFSNFSFNEVN